MIDLLGTIVMWSIVAIGTVFALTFVGLDVAPLWMLIIFVGIVFVIGGRTLLESFGAGLLLQSRSPFEPGDFVKLGEDSGVVVEVNSRVVVVDAVDGRRLFIPNTNVLNNTIENLTHRKLRMSTLYLDVEYGTDLDKAIALAESSAKGEELVLERPPPQALVSEFATSSVQITYRFWHEPTLIGEWNAVDAAARAVYKAYRDNGIVFAFPNQTLWWGDKNQNGPADNTES
jgi:small-conductance mechanosensitive channel